MTEEKQDLNSIVDIKKFLTTEENPLSGAEFTAFWQSLSDEEKDEFKNTELPES